jgi:predicted transcriptional regulator of viral defense system
MGRADALHSLRRFGGRPFRLGDAERAGVPRYGIYRLRDRGDVIELARGVYQVAGADPSSAIDLTTVSARVPKGTIALNSALAYWDLSDEIPSSVHVAVPRGAHPPKIDFPPTTVHVFASETFDLGRERRAGEDGGEFWITSRERSVVDAMRLPRLVGRDQALGALRRYLDAAGARPGELAALGRQLKAGPQLSEALEVLLS